MTVLLLSGGLDSTAVAAWMRPDTALTIDYGQRAAQGEITAARAVSNALDIPWATVRVDCSPVGGGMLAGEGDDEFWPYRNQLLITLAAAWAANHGHQEVMLGTVADDTHLDCAPTFIDGLNDLLRTQEPAIHLTAPARDLTGSELLTHSPIDAGLIGWTHSCNRSPLACGACPSCGRRAALLGFA